MDARRHRPRRRPRCTSTPRPSHALVPQPLCTWIRRADLHGCRVVHSFHRCYDYYVPLDMTIIREHPSGPRPGDNPRTGIPVVRGPVRKPHRTSRCRSLHGRIRIPAHTRCTVRRPEGTTREVPRRTRRARRCRRLGCPQPAGPPQRARPGRPAHRGQRRRAGALDLRLRDLGARDAHRRGQRRGPGPGQRPAARRHLPQPPGQAGRDGPRRRPGLADLRLGPVQPPDDAGRGLPDAARHAGRHRHRRRATRSPTPSPRRSPPPAATTCCRCSPASGSRSTARRSRCSPPTGSGSRTASSTGTRAPPTSPLAALVPGQGARRHRQVADRRRRGHHRARHHRVGRGHHRLRGPRPRAAPAARRPACSTASSPRSAACSPAEHLTTAHGRQGRADRVGQAGRARRRAQHRRPAGVQRRRADPRRRLRRRGAGLGVDRGRRSTARTSPPGFNPQFLLDGLTAIDEAVVELAFTQASKPVVHQRLRSPRASDDSAFRYLLMPRRLLS